MLASLFILCVLVSILVIDWIFLPKQVRRAFWIMAFVFSVMALLSLFPDLLSQMAALVGIGRGVDLLVYVSLIVLTREYFLSRARQTVLEGQVTALVRQIAIQDSRNAQRGQFGSSGE